MVVILIFYFAEWHLWGSGTENESVQLSKKVVLSLILRKGKQLGKWNLIILDTAKAVELLVM